MKRRICGTDFSFFVSISAPEAGPEELRTMCDWGNWVGTFFDPRIKLRRFAGGLIFPTQVFPWDDSPLNLTEADD